MAKNDNKLYIKRKKLYYFLTLLVFLFILFLVMTFIGHSDISEYEAILEFNFTSKIYYEFYFEIGVSIILTIIIVRVWLIIYKMINNARFNRNYKKNVEYMKQQAITYYICPKCGNQTDLKEVFCPHMNKCKYYKKNKGANCFAKQVNNFMDKDQDVKEQLNSVNSLCVYNNSKKFKYNYYSCKYASKCEKTECFIKSMKYDKFNFSSAESDYKKAVNAYLGCEKFRKYQRFDARIRCLETGCKHHIEYVNPSNPNKKVKHPCSLSIEKGVSLAPNIMSPKKLKCKNGKKINLLFEKNLTVVDKFVSLNNQTSPTFSNGKYDLNNTGGVKYKNTKNAKICIVCNGKSKMHTSVNSYDRTNVKNACLNPLKINKGVNYTFALIGLPNSGKTSFIMNIFHLLRMRMEYTSSKIDVNFDDEGVLDYEAYIQYNYENKNTELEKTNPQKYNKNYSFSFTDGSYTFNFSDRPGESLTYAGDSEKKDPTKVKLKYTLPNNYNGIIYVYNPYMSLNFRKEYGITQIRTTETHDIKDMNEFAAAAVKETNNYIYGDKKTAFIFQKTDLFFNVDNIETTDNSKIITLKKKPNELEGKKIEILCNSLVDENDSDKWDNVVRNSMIEEEGNYKVQLLEYEIGTFCIRHVQAIIYKLKHGISFDDNYDFLMNFSTGRAIISALFAYILSLINDKRFFGETVDEAYKQKVFSFINKRYIKEVDNSYLNIPNQNVIITDKEIINIDKLNHIDRIKNYLNKELEGTINEDSLFYKLAQANISFIKHTSNEGEILDDNLFYVSLFSTLTEKVFTTDSSGISDPNDIMNLAVVCFCYAYKGNELIEAFYQKNIIKKSDDLRTMLKYKHFFTCNAYYKNFDRSKNSEGVPQTDLFTVKQNINVLNVDNRTINPVIWILENDDPTSKNEVSNYLINNIMGEGWK